jgi:hypothetical protein
MSGLRLFQLLLNEQVRAGVGLSELKVSADSMFMSISSLVSA